MWNMKALNSSLLMIFKDCLTNVHFNDITFTLCQIPANQSACQLLQQVHFVREVRNILISIPFSLSLLAALFNGTFGVLTLHFYMRCKRFVDHHHALLLSETISALLHQLLLYCSLIAMSFNSEFGYTSTAAFFSIALATLFVHSGSYFANTSLLFLAIVRPLKYRSPLTARQSIRLLTVIWLSSSLIATCMGLSAAALFYPQSTSIKCLLDRCKWPLGFMIVCVFAIFYVVVILLYLIMIWHLNKRRHNDMQKQDCNNQVLWESNVRAMKRLTLQLIAFTLSGAPILGVSAFTLLNLDRIKLLGLESSSPCAFFLKCDLFAQAERLVCVNVSACILPMIIVPLINCYVDGHSREVLQHKFGYASTKTNHTNICSEHRVCSARSPT